MAESGIRKLYTLKLREEYRQMVQPSGEDVVKRMEEQIIRFGCGEPIYVWSRRLLVDYDRYEIFHRLHIPFRIVNCSARNSEEVIDWICRNQLQRTDLTDAMRRYLIGRQYLALKLLGAHYAASTPPARNCRISSVNTSRYEATPIRIRERLGKLYHIRQETVERYAAYMKAIDIVRAAAPDLAEGMLSGQLWLTVDHVMELPHKTPEEIRKLNDLLCGKTENLGKRDLLRELLPAKKRSAAVTPAPPAVSVKDMPCYDPDAEIASLTLTIPAWVSSMRRTNQSIDFRAVSIGAKQAARKELIQLKNEVEALLHAIKKEG